MYDRIPDSLFVGLRFPNVRLIVTPSRVSLRAKVLKFAGGWHVYYYYNLQIIIIHNEIPILHRFFFFAESDYNIITIVLLFFVTVALVVLQFTTWFKIRLYVKRRSEKN